MAASPGRSADWHHDLTWNGRRTWIVAETGGRYVLHTPTVTRAIAPQRFVARTASPLFDGLFAMAQADLRQDSVQAITDPAFNHGKPIRCRCFSAGAQWPFVWTRDLSYSIDLGLWRFDRRRAMASLRFKLSSPRIDGDRAGEYVMQDTGSGGSWPISTDRVVWFLGARHLLDSRAFADTVYRALNDTLTQDRRYAYDPATGLYRGETSFLDWREQSYPAWTSDNVVFIAQSFALSTNVLHYQALRLAARMAGQRRDAADHARYARQADALKRAINLHFWNAGRGMYRSYVGGRIRPAPFEAYDLLGTDLAITSGVADPARAREALAHYPTWPAGSPVIWPERHGQPIYHNRAIWPFVSEYTLRAARRADDPTRIAHELRSQMRGAALYASNMENYSLQAQSIHVDEGRLSGPVVDSPRQLWSVAGYLDMVLRGVFGLEDDNRVVPKLPTSLLPLLFGDRASIRLELGDRSIVLLRPTAAGGDLLVAGSIRRRARETVVQLVPGQIGPRSLRLDASMYSPQWPPAPVVIAAGRYWRVSSATPALLYVDGRRHGAIEGDVLLARRTDSLQCFSLTTVGSDGLESLHSPEVCRGPTQKVGGAWPRRWIAPHAGAFQAHLSYVNEHGPINTGITAAVRRLRIRCGSERAQIRAVVMPQGHGHQDSTDAPFHVGAETRCTFDLEPGFNMSDLARFALYTGGQGGVTGPLNAADIGDLEIAPLPAGEERAP